MEAFFYWTPQGETRPPSPLTSVEQLTHQWNNKDCLPVFAARRADVILCIRRLASSKYSVASSDFHSYFPSFDAAPTAIMSLFLGTLTKVLTPSPSCLDTTNLWQFDVSVGTDPVWYDLFGSPPTSDCLPPNYNAASTAYYYPGVFQADIQSRKARRLQLDSQRRRGSSVAQRAYELGRRRLV
jgi:hypothetical protein